MTFRWFSELVDDCLEKPADVALQELGELIRSAALDKQDGYGPPEDAINQGRRKWLDLYEKTYPRRAA